jgi:hypothetical protein
MSKKSIIVLMYHHHKLLYPIRDVVLWGTICLCILESAVFVVVLSVNLLGSFQLFENLITSLVKCMCHALL